MAEKEEQKTRAETVFSDWTNLAAGFLSNIGNLWALPGGAKPGEDTKEGRAGEKGPEPSGALPKNWLEWSLALQEPLSLGSMVQGLGNMPRIFAQRAESRWDRFLGLQNEWLQKIAAVGDRTKSFSFDYLDQQLLVLWNDTYDREIRRYLKMPAVGLARFYQERAARFIDSFNVFLNAWEAFSRLLAEPLEQTSRDMAAKMEDPAENERVFSDPHEIYNLWIKVLEGHYMTLFKSEKYGQAMGRAMDAFGNFVIARKDLLEDFLKVFPVATERDSHDLYKELYDMKNQVKELTRNVKDLQKKLEETPGRKPNGPNRDPGRSDSRKTGRSGTKAGRHPPEGS